MQCKHIGKNIDNIQALTIIRPHVFVTSQIKHEFT